MKKRPHWCWPVGKPSMIGVDDPGGAVDDVERRLKRVLLGLAGREVGRVLVGHPAGVDGVEVDAVAA